MQKIKAYLIDVYQNCAGMVEIEPTLKNYYQLLKCSLVEMPTRAIGDLNHIYTIICDEEGTFREDARISAIDDYGTVQLVGNLLIVAHNPDVASERGLTESDINWIEKNVKNTATVMHRDGYKMLHNCMYV